MNPELLLLIIGAVFGSSGVLWAVLAASRKRPQVVLHVKGHGTRVSETKDSHDIYFHVVIRNKSSEKNSIDKLIFAIWNSRKTEYIWEAWHVELFKPNKETNWIGDKIDVPVVVDGKAGIECIAVLTMPNEVFFRYLGDRMHGNLSKASSYEKPFPYQLFLRDSFGNHYTGGLNTDESVLVDYGSLRHMSVLNTDITNDCAYARPRLKHIRKFYTGRMLKLVRFKVRLALYYLGVVSSV